MTSDDFALAIAQATAAGDTVRLATLAMQLLSRARAAEELEEEQQRRRDRDARRKAELRGPRQVRRSPQPSTDNGGNPQTSADVRGNPRTSPLVPPSPPLPGPIPSTPPYNPPSPPAVSAVADELLAAVPADARGEAMPDRQETLEEGPREESRRALQGDHRELDGLPEHAVRLVTLFYADSRASKRKDAIDQLRDTLDPRRPGAQLDRNTWVQAAGPTQLDAACKRVLENPPRNLELGARFVLHELTKLQAAKRINATEGAAARAAAEERRYRRWRGARARAVMAWESDLDNQATAGELRAKVAAKLGLPEDVLEQTFAQQAIGELYAQAVADICGFPELEQWQDPQERGRLSSRST